MSVETIHRIYEILLQITVALGCAVATVIVLLCVLAFLNNAAEVIRDTARE